MKEGRIAALFNQFFLLSIIVRPMLAILPFPFLGIAQSISYLMFGMCMLPPLIPCSRVISATIMNLRLPTPTRPSIAIEHSHQEQGAGISIAGTGDAQLMIDGARSAQSN